MADYDPKIIPTLDDIIEDDIDEEIKETVIDLSSLLADKVDEDDDNFDLFTAEVEVGIDDTDTEAGIEDDSPQIGMIDDIETAGTLDIDSELSSVADADLDTTAIDIEISGSDDIDIDIENSSETLPVDLDTLETAETGTAEIEAAVIEIDTIDIEETVVGEIEIYADEEIEPALPDDEEPVESALINYHAEEEDDIVIDTHHAAEGDSPAQVEAEIEQETEADTYAPAEEASTGIRPEDIPEVTHEVAAPVSDEDVDSAIVESAIIGPDAGSEDDTETSLVASDVLSTVTLEELSDNIIQQLMPELEQQLRFLVLKTLHEKLPAEITRQLSPNSAHEDDDGAGDQQ
ncbi:MAG: hypothetical protein IMF14_04070 [Proteobacteria bacterium]|nr:hypothetical protein [Pseudomonadota bacterium]